MQFPPFLIRRLQTPALFLLVLIITLLAQVPVGARDAADPAGESVTYLPLMISGEGGPAPPPGGDYLLYAFSDALRLDPASMLEEDLDAFKVVYCDTSGLPAPVTLSLAQAKANAWNYLQQLAGATALDGVESDLSGRSLGEIDSFVAAATAAGQTEAALAALLIAIERFPDEPMPLVNAAALLSSSGLPNEAIAFLDAAAASGRPYGTPMGVDGEQIALNNRAHAFLMRGQWAEAAAILEGVVAAEPQLAEARMNLSRALLCQGDTPRAALWYRLAQRRMVWDVVEDGPEINDQMIPIEVILDTSAGELLTINDVPKPVRAEQVPDYVPLYEQMNEDYNALVLALTAERPALEDAYYNRTLPTLQKIRLDSLASAFSFAQDQPQVRVLWDEAQVLSNELKVMEDDTIVELTLLWQSGGELEQIKTECRAILSEHVTEYVDTFYEYENVMQDYMTLLYAIQTGVLANAHDAPLHALMMNHLELNMETTRQLLVPYGWSVNTANYWALCEGDEEEIDEAADALGMPAPGQCSPSVKGTKIGLDLRIVSFSITCEIAEVEFSTGGPLGPFLQVTHDLRKNEITTFFGAKATVMIGPLLELGAKEGFYVRANQDGFTDAGMKVATGGAAHLGGSGISGQVDGPEFEAGVAAAVEYWTGP